MQNELELEMELDWARERATAVLSTGDFNALGTHLAQQFRAGELSGLAMRVVLNECAPRAARRAYLPVTAGELRQLWAAGYEGAVALECAA